MFGRPYLNQYTDIREQFRKKYESFKLISHFYTIPFEIRED